MNKQFQGVFIITAAMLLCLAGVGCVTNGVQTKSVLARGQQPQDIEENTAEKHTGARVALVIGNASYPNSPLNNPTNDAEDMATALQRFGFDVMLRTNLDQVGMNDAIAAFGRKSHNAEVAMFFYAGHGVQNKNRNYMIPITATFNDETTLIDESVGINSLLDILDKTNSQVKIIVLDACRNNPIDKSNVRAVRGLARIQPAKGTMIVYATEPGKTAEDGPGRNGLLTQGLLTAFQGNDLSLASVLTTASEKMEQASANQQVLHTDGPETLKNRFYFSTGQ